MAEEKKELKNYTRIFNPILEAIVKHRQLNASDICVFFCIVRLTYGWNKKCDPISRSILMEMTGLAEPTVKKSIKKLVKQKIIIEYGFDKKSRCKVLGVNKRLGSWGVEGVQLDPVQSDPLRGSNRIPYGGTNRSPEGVQSDPHKRQFKDSKDNLKKNKKTNFFSPDGYLIKELDDEYGYYHDKDGNVCRAERKKLIQKEVDA